MGEPPLLECELLPSPVTSETTAVVDCDQTGSSEPVQSALANQDNLGVIKAEECQSTISEQHDPQMSKDNKSWSKLLPCDVDLLRTDNSTQLPSGSEQLRVANANDIKHDH